MPFPARALFGVPLLLAALPARAQDKPARDEIVVSAEHVVEEAIQRVKAQLRKPFTLFADARNLIDRKASGEVSAMLAYAPASAIFYPVERRSVFAGIRAAFP